jgi:NADPH:quinone reductase-like Zn-dependent oxidoreductase
MKLRYKIAGTLLAVVLVGMTVLGVMMSHNSACEPAPELSANAEPMKAIMNRCYGSPDVLTLENVEKPKPADGEVLVKVKAAAVNPLDWHYMRGTPHIMRLMGAGIGKPESQSMGVDFAGTVEAVGENVTRFKPGDDVFGGGSGAFAEFLTISEDRSIAAKPANVSFQEAAAVPIAAITALQALRDKGKIKAGQRVLINGASGGVGTFAVQIAKSFGAEVTGVCSGRNAEMVRSIGADHVIDYKTEDYTENSQQYDLIVDMVGNHSLSKNRQALKPEGTFVIVGGESGDWLGPLAAPIKAMMYSPFVDQEFVMLMAQMRQSDLAVLADLMKAGKLTPILDRSYALSEVPAAIRYSEEGHAQGKIIINLE